MTRKVLSPYFPFNPNKEDANGKKVFKSPMLKTSKVSLFVIIINSGVSQESCDRYEAHNGREDKQQSNSISE